MKGGAKARKGVKGKPLPVILKEPHDKGKTYNKGMIKLRAMLKKSDEQKVEENEQIDETQYPTDDGVFAKLKARRQEEEYCLDFLDKNRRVYFHGKCAAEADQFYNDNFATYLYKRARRPADSESELKAKFKKSYGNKKLFEENRASRNEEYVCQRKHDFAVSQQRVEKLTQKLREEYENMVSEYLKRCERWAERTEKKSSEQINDIAKASSERICDTAAELTEVSQSLSFVPYYYSDIVKYFHDSNMTFKKDDPKIVEFTLKNYMKPLRDDTQRLFVTMSEACIPESMVPPLVERRGRAVCVLMKPLVYTEDECEAMASSLGWKPVFASRFDNAVVELFEILSTTEEDVMVFDFPRTPKELKDIYMLFNPLTEQGDDGQLLQRPVPSIVMPFDMILELDVSDEIVLRDVLAEVEDSEDGMRYDLRQMFPETEEQLVRLRPVPDYNFDLLQYPSRAVTLKTNFDLIAESNKEIFKKVVLENRLMNQDAMDQIAPLLNDIVAPAKPQYPPTAVYGALLDSAKNMPDELKEFFISQWKSIESLYNESAKRAIELLDQAHFVMYGHLQKARTEMQQFLSRPCSSQHLVVEFQQWHCSQVERGMRRMQKVKDECNLRLNAMRESLVQIENDRKMEEEVKQKDLTNAPFRTTLFELVNNACTMLAQAEIDRWTATRNLMMDYNQVISDTDLVPPLQRKKLNVAVDPSRSNPKKGAKKPTRTTPTSRSRNESKLQSFESPLFEQLEAIKKFVQDASVIYVRATTPVSTRGKSRPTKDKNPFAVHKITALEEFSPAFAEDDIYLIARMDQITQMAHDEIQAVQQSFDAFVEDSTTWIQSNYERRKAIADTAVAYMLQKVSDEAQLNNLIFLHEDKCVVDFTQLLVGTEEVPKIPPPFPEELIHESIAGSPEQMLQNVLKFDQETNTQ